jgi:nitrile hydratase
MISETDQTVEDITHDHTHEAEHSHLDDTALRVRSLQSLLMAKGYVDQDTLNALIDTYEHQVGPRNGARVVARAWVDPQYRQWLQEDATAAIASLDYSGRQGEHMVAVENTDEVHNLVVCTLCSCYPWPVLGLPPAWYKSAPYRSRVVIDPKGVLAEFGVTLPDHKRVVVWDSTAEVRYLVIPQRPANSELLTESQLAQLVSRNSMIGTALVDPVEPRK